MGLIMKERLLHELRRFKALRDDFDEYGYKDSIEYRTQDREKPDFFDFEHLQLPDILSKRLLELGIDKLYKHQIEAIKAIRQGHDIALVTPTASGKTIAFCIPIIESMLKDRNCFTLFVYPMKALANDQRLQITELIEVDEKTLLLDCWLFNGDTPKEHRSLLKQNPIPLLLTTPEEIHLSFLGWCDQWREYLRKVKFLVLDEIHEYRGYFGTNMSILFRRFLRKLNELGVRPQIILSSATIANPRDHCKNLTGREIKIINATNSGRCKRDFFFINPSIPQGVFWERFLWRIANASLACISLNLSTIVFCPTRKFVEEATKIARRESSKYFINPDLIVPYKSGILPDKRREVEHGLRVGKFKLVFSTNALEIGINIGKLDVCILAGFPENIFSTWQRIGRVGRSWDKDAFVLVYALNNPIDQFYINHVDNFLEKPLDQIAISTTNEELIKQHLPSFLYERERPLALPDDKLILGDLFYQLAQEHQQNTEKVKIKTYRPHVNTPIRNIYGAEYDLIHGKTVIGTISEEKIFTEAYLGAIYNHFGKSYKVKSHGQKEIELESAPEHLKTNPSIFKAVAINDIYCGEKFDNSFAKMYGKLTIYENFCGYKLIDERTDEIIDEQRLGVYKTRTVNPQGFWFSIENDEIIQQGFDINSLRILERALRVSVPFIVPCDFYDLSSTYSTENTTIYIYETVPGGIGIVEKLNTIFSDILNYAIKIVEDCDCVNGCPKCVHIPRCDYNVDTLDKNNGLTLMKYIRNSLNNLTSTFEKKMGGWVKYDPSVNTT